MVDTCTIRRQQDAYAAGTLDPDTLELTEDPGDEIYSGKCFIAPSGIQARREDVGGNDAGQKTYLISIPFDAPELRPGDEVTVDASADPALAGKTFGLQDVTMATVLVWRQANMIGLETSRG